MIQERSDELINAIKKVQRQQIIGHIIVIAYTTFVIFHICNSKQVSVSQLIIIGFIALVALRYPYSSIRRNLLMNRIVIEILSDDKNITFKTADIFIFFPVFHKKSIVFTIPINETHFELTNDDFGKLLSKNPIAMKEWTYNGKSYNLTNNNEQYLILTGFFSDKVENMIDSSLSANEAS